MKKILYLTHTPWSWIKQRPQFLAEGLAKEFEVDVYYRKSNHLKGNLNPAPFKEGNLYVTGFRNIPWERIKSIKPEMLYPINKVLWYFTNINITEYDYIWVTDPLLWWLIKDKKHHAKVIYDCMDDLIAFPYYEKYPNVVDFTVSEEKTLLETADYVFFSAQTLKDKLFLRYNIDRGYFIVNNAITDNITRYSENENRVSLPKNSFVYIGTISEWFDFSLIIKTLNKNPHIHFVLFGPIRMSMPPQHERLIYAGTIEHNQILEVMSKSTGLVMPFVINDLILSVNPVKLYEYIYSGRPIAAIRYPETEKFGKHVTLYSGEDEFDDFIRKAVNGDFTTNKDDMKKFALDNRWQSRCETIISILNS